MSKETHPPRRLTRDVLAQQFPLNAERYSLEGDELMFMQIQTGITDKEALKNHISIVQSEAYAIYPYPCIQAFEFLRAKLPRLPGYNQLLKLGKERPNAVFLDLGCCFGHDVRWAVADGFPVRQIVASDLHAEYWDLGHRLFRSTSESFPAKFVPGDVFDPAHITVTPPFYAPPVDTLPDLSALTSLNPLRGHVSAIHSSAFFHLFDEEKQEHIARAMGGLLSPEPGSIILGTHSTSTRKGWRDIDAGATLRIFDHSPESWTALWDGKVFGKGTVEVEAKIVEREDVMPGRKFPFMVWCVTRL